MMPIPNKLRRLEDIPFPLKFPEPGQGVLGVHPPMWHRPHCDDRLAINVQADY